MLKFFVSFMVVLIVAPVVSAATKHSAVIEGLQKRLGHNLTESEVQGATEFFQNTSKKKVQKKKSQNTNKIKPLVSRFKRT